MTNYNSPMNLAAKASAGYAMAALLVGMAVMAIMMSVAMPTWSQMIRREKEEELLFRGMQYARAINQYQRKFANASPASLDVLIEQRLLRKKFRDPLSPNKDGEFQMLYLNNQGTSGRGAGSGPGSGAGTQTGTTLSTTPSGGIVGVTSKNTGTSIKVYKGKNKYNEWQFVGMEQSQQAGPAGGAGGRGGSQRGGRGDGGLGGREGRGSTIATGPGGSTFRENRTGETRQPSRQGR